MPEYWYLELLEMQSNTIVAVWLLRITKKTGDVAKEAKYNKKFSKEHTLELLEVYSL